MFVFVKYLFVFLMHFYFALFSFQGSNLTALRSARRITSSALASICFANRNSLCFGMFCHTMVGTSGLEPPTSRLSGVRSNHLSYAPMFLGLFTCYPHNPFPGSCGGDEEDRTPDPLRARQMLSQLSYTPIPSSTFKTEQCISSTLAD